MSVNVTRVKEQLFNLNDPAEKAFSLFEVVNTCGPGYGDPDKLPVSMVEYAAYPGYGKP